MKKIIAAAALSAFISAPAFAEFEKSKLSIGASYGLANNGVISFRGDYDISDRTKKPIKVRVGYDRYKIDYGGGFFGNYSWSYNVFYGGAYYYLDEFIELDSKIHPFAGLGLGFGSVSCSGSLCNGLSSPTVGGLYYIAGVQYDLNDQFSAEASYNVWGGITLGANYHF